jgi:hypothetical protein
MRTEGQKPVLKQKKSIRESIIALMDTVIVKIIFTFFLLLFLVSITTSPYQRGCKLNQAPGDRLLHLTRAANIEAQHIGNITAV